MTDLKRIAAVNDISGVGKCSLTVALPIISAAGVECACMPTALLSTHTGEFTGWTFRDLSDQMLPIAEHWRREGVRFDGVYSGYLASPEQETVLERVLDVIAEPDSLIIADPAMADNGGYYSGFDGRMCAAFRHLCARADVITPNITEAALLAGMDYRAGLHSPEYVDALLCALAGICGGHVVITGVMPEPGCVGVVARSPGGELCSVMRPLRDGLFHGAGDVFASALSALLVRGAPLPDAVGAASALVEDSIERTVIRGAPRRFGMDFEGALPGFVSRVAELFPL